MAREISHLGATFTVPQGSTAGLKTVNIIDNKFNYASANFTVTTSSINMTPQIGPVGTVVTVTGSNFIDNSIIAINFDGNPVITNPSIVTATATGSYSATFVIPPVAAGNRTVLANDGANSVNTNFVVTPTISITPTRGVTGTQVSISGQGFAAQSNLIVTFEGIAVTISGNPSTNVTGSFSNLFFTAQSPSLGIKSVNVTDDSGNVGNCSFKIVALDHFNLDGYPSSANAGQNFASNNLVVIAYDADSYVLKGYVGQVYFSSSDSQALLPNTFTSMYTFTTNDVGVHTFAGSGFTLKTAGSEILTVTDGTKSNSTTIVVNPATLEHFIFNSISGSQVAGTAFSITITAKDAYENTVTSYVSSNGLTVSTGTINPTTTGNFASGTKTISVTLAGAGPSVTIGTAGGAPVKSGTSNAFTVNPGVIHHFTMAGLPASVIAGQVFGNVVVTAYDANNNVKTDYTGQVYFTSTDGAAVLPFTSVGKYLFTSGSGLDNGVHTFSGFALKTVAGGSKTITVTDGSVSLLSGSIAVGFASVDHFVVSGFTNPVVAGTAGTVTVTAKDPYGNTVTSYVGTVHITSSDSAAVLPVDHALASGTSSFTVTLKTTVTRSITATDTATGLITGSQTGITVNPAAIASFTVTGYPSSVAAGASFGGVVVTANDIYGNIKTDFTSTVYFTSTDGVAVLPYTSGSRYTFLSGDLGVHVFAGFTLKTVGSRTITVTDATRSAVSTGITVNPAALDHFIFNSVGAQIGGSAFSLTVTAQDAFGNTVTGYIGMPSLTYSAGSINPGIMNAFVSGVGSTSVTVSLAGSSVTITATDGTNTGTSNSFTVAHASAVDHITDSVSPTTVVAPATATGTATAYDVYGNTWAVSTLATWSIPAGGDGGSWSSNVYTSHTAGTYTIQAAYSGKTTTTSLTVKYAPHYVDTANALHDINVGTYSSLVAMQAGPDGVYNTLTEANTIPTTTTMGTTTNIGTLYTAIAIDDIAGQAFTAPANAISVASVTFYGRTSFGTFNVKVIITDSTGHILANGISNTVSCSTTEQSRTATFTTPPTITAGSTYEILIISQSNTFRLYYVASSGGISISDVTNSYTTPSDPTDASSGTVNYRAFYATVNRGNYQLDSEVQFSSVSNFASYTQLQIQTGTFSSPSETITVNYWNGAIWANLGILTASSLNTFSVTLTSSTYELRFTDGTTTNDIVQSTWQIDSVCLVAP